MPGRVTVVKIQSADTVSVVVERLAIGETEAGEAEAPGAEVGELEFVGAGAGAGAGGSEPVGVGPGAVDAAEAAAGGVDAGGGEADGAEAGKAESDAVVRFVLCVAEAGGAESEELVADGDEVEGPELIELRLGMEGATGAEPGGLEVGGGKAEPSPSVGLPVLVLVASVGC